MKATSILAAGLVALSVRVYAGDINAPAIEWAAIPGGSFAMGTDDIGDSYVGFKDAKPVHQVTIRPFNMSKTLVTVAQYKDCVDQGACPEPRTGAYCNWGLAGREQHPVNCVNWDGANLYAKFVGGGARLPTEAEWEYAARSGGKDQKYPWGNEIPGCDNYRAVMCGEGTMPVCSTPAGNTKIEGLPADRQLCDMAGNVFQWVQDKYKDSYAGAPADGSAFEDKDVSLSRVILYAGRFGMVPFDGGDYSRVVRGGSFNGSDPRRLRADHRNDDDPGRRSTGFIGFRLARSR